MATGEVGQIRHNIMNVIGTGLSGLVGSRIIELLSDHIRFESLGLENGIDITNHKSVFDVLTKSTADWVFHLAAYTDVQKAEKEREKGKESVAWQVNVEATKILWRFVTPHESICCISIQTTHLMVRKRYMKRQIHQIQKVGMLLQKLKVLSTCCRLVYTV